MSETSEIQEFEDMDANQINDTRIKVQEQSIDSLFQQKDQLHYVAKKSIAPKHDF